MSVLSNPKHERFAQLLWKGKTADEAYAEAGYKANRGNAATLKANQNILDRVAELQERTALKAELTIADIAAQLDEDRQLAHGEGQAGAAVAATMGKAKLYGLITDKTEMKAQIVVSKGPDLSGMNDEQLRVLASIPLG